MSAELASAHMTDQTNQSECSTAKKGNVRSTDHSDRVAPAYTDVSTVQTGDIPQVEQLSLGETKMRATVEPKPSPPAKPMKLKPEPKTKPRLLVKPVVPLHRSPPVSAAMSSPEPNGDYASGGEAASRIYSELETIFRPPNPHSAKNPTANSERSTAVSQNELETSSIPEPLGKPPSLKNETLAYSNNEHAKHFTVPEVSDTEESPNEMRRHNALRRRIHPSPRRGMSVVPPNEVHVAKSVEVHAAPPEPPPNRCKPKLISPAASSCLQVKSESYTRPELHAKCNAVNEEPGDAFETSAVLRSQTFTIHARPEVEASPLYDDPRDELFPKHAGVRVVPKSSRAINEEACCADGSKCELHHNAGAKELRSNRTVEASVALPPEPLAEAPSLSYLSLSSAPSSLVSDIETELADAASLVEPEITADCWVAAEGFSSVALPPEPSEEAPQLPRGSSEGSACVNPPTKEARILAPSRVLKKERKPLIVAEGEKVMSPRAPEQETFDEGASSEIMPNFEEVPAEPSPSRRRTPKHSAKYVFARRIAKKCLTSKMRKSYLAAPVVVVNVSCNFPVEYFNSKMHGK